MADFTFEGLLRDPEFRALSPAAQIAGLREVDPEFGELSIDAQQAALADPEFQPRTPTSLANRALSGSGLSVAPPPTPGAPGTPGILATARDLTMGRPDLPASQDIDRATTVAAESTIEMIKRQTQELIAPTVDEIGRQAHQRAISQVDPGIRRVPTTANPQGVGFAKPSEVFGENILTEFLLDPLAQPDPSDLVNPIGPLISKPAKTALRKLGLEAGEAVGDVVGPAGQRVPGLVKGGTPKASPFPDPSKRFLRAQPTTAGETPKPPAAKKAKLRGSKEAVRERVSGITELPSQPGKKPEPKPALPTKTFAQGQLGRKAKAKTARGTEIETQFAVVDADELITSNTDALAVNERFPQELQPRDRTRLSSEAQISELEQKLDPELLAESIQASDGAPIVGPDLVVESGNARTIAIRRAFQKDLPSSRKLREFITENADRFGLSTERISGIKKPVLVRLRRTDVDRVKFAQEANEANVATFSAGELARQDAKKLSGDLLETFEASETGEIITAGNRDFVRNFLQQVVSPADRAKLVDAKGQISQDGVSRIRNAVFAKAYGETRAIERLAESVDNSARNISNGMLRAAPKFARLNDAIAKGERFDLGLADDIGEAAETIARLRDENQSVSDFLAQENLFEGRKTIVDRLVGTLDKNKRSSKKIGEILGAYADTVESLGSPKQLSLLGGGRTPNRSEILETAIRFVEEGDARQAQLFAETQTRAGARVGGKKTPASPEGVPSPKLTRDPERGAASIDVLTGGAAKGLPQRPPKAKLGGPLAKFRQSFKQAQAETPSKLQRVRTELIDRFAPLDDLTKAARPKLKPDEDPFVAARLFAGHLGKVQNRLDDLQQVLTPVRTDRQTLVEHAVMERFEELAERGITDFPGGRSIGEIRAAKKELESALPSERLKAIRQTERGIREYSRRLLTEAREAGLFSKEQFDAIVSKNEKYIPLNRVGFVDEKTLDALPRGSRAFSLSRQDLVRSIKGSKREVQDPLESLVRNTFRTVNQIERNKVARKVWDLADREEFSELVLRMGPNQKAPVGFDKVSVLIDGVKHEAAVPAEVAEALKGLNRKQADIITQVASKSAGALRAGATSLNLAFIIPNIVRDFQTATLVSKVGFTPLDWFKGFAEAIRKGDVYREFLESGASFSGFFEQQKSLRTSGRKLTRSKTLDKAIKVTNPLELVRTLGEISELTTRLGTFSRARRLGKSSTEAAFISRTATVDFARSGSTVQLFNRWIPFLNARLQGTLNAAAAVKDNPLRSAATVGALVGVPAVITYLNNTRMFPEVWEDIADFEKQNNFLLIWGDERDDKGNPTQVVKIPKGDIGRFFGNPIENGLAFFDGRDRQTMDALALELLSDVSPISFVREGEISGTMIGASAIPPTAKAVLEGSTNVNFFTGRPIVPRRLQGASPEQQFKADTPRTIVKLGQFLKMSPLKIQNAIGTQFGGLGRQLAEPSSAGRQVARRFFGARGGQVEQKAFESLDEALRAHEDVRVENQRRAEKLFERMKDVPASTRQQIFQQAVRSGEATPGVIEDLGEIVRLEAAGLSSFERSLKRTPVSVRARMILQQLEPLTPREKGEKVAEWTKKRIITRAVAEQMGELVRQRGSSQRQRLRGSGARGNSASR